MSKPVLPFSLPYDVAAFRDGGGSWESPELRVVIETLEHFGVKLGLQRIDHALEILGDAVAPVPAIVVGGTNGKGSSTAYLQSMLTAHGLRTGRSTSPHLTHLRERIAVDDQLIDDQSLLRHFERLLGLREHPDLSELTFFEAITVLARLYFVEQACDAAVYEVGLGGRLDATQRCTDRVCLVTNIGLDHVKTLGPTKRHIAIEKASIVPAGGLLIVNERDPDLQETMCGVAKERDAQVLCVGSDFDGGLREDGIWFRMRARGFPPLELSGLQPKMRGQHQTDNVVGAIAALVAFSVEGGSRVRSQAMALSPQAIASAVSATTVAGRYEFFDAPVPIIVDGAHNAEGAQALVHTVQRDERLPDRCYGILAASHGKEFGAITTLLSEAIHIPVITSALHHRSMDAKTISDTWQIPGARYIDDPFDALELVQNWAQEHGDGIIIAGSLYLIGALRPLLVRQVLTTSSPDQRVRQRHPGRPQP